MDNDCKKILKLMEQVFQTRIKNFELIDFHQSKDCGYYHGLIVMTNGLVFDDEISRLHIVHIGYYDVNKIQLTICMSKKVYDNLYIE